MHSPDLAKLESRGRDVSDVDALIQGYSNYLQAHLKSKRTVEDYARDVRRWYRWWNKPLDDFGPEAWDRWLDSMVDRQLKGISIRRQQSSLRKFYKYLRRKGLSTQDPSKDAEPVQIAKKFPEFLSEEEVSKMYDSCDGDLRQLAMLELLYSCGLRNSELRDIRPEDVSKNHVRVHGKGDKTRLVAISEKSWTVINAFVGCRKAGFYAFGRDKGSRMAIDTVQRVVAKMARSAGISKRVTPHTLRHSIATHLACRGVVAEKLQIFLGHNDIKTTMIYVHIAEQMANAAVLAVHPRG